MTTETTSDALRVALAYHRAWTARDLDRAMEHIAESFVCDAPPGRIEGAERFRAFMAPFVEMLVGSELAAAFGDERRAVLVYDTETTLVESGPGAELLTVDDGRITYLRLLFDRLPFEAARREAAGSSGSG